MARDCPDRQRGANWRNDAPAPVPGRGPAGRIGGGDAVDREYEVSKIIHCRTGSIADSVQQLMQELSGNAPAGNGEAPQRIEAGPGGYENGNGDTFGDGDRDLKPWQRGPTGASAPWARGGDDHGRRDDYQSRDGGAAPPWTGSGGGRGGDNYASHNQHNAGYGGPPGGAAPWQRQHEAPPHSGGQQGYGYGGYPGGGYGESSGGYAQQSMGAPPGLHGGAGGLGAPPGLGALFQNYGSNGSAGNAPPPPPPGDAPPPPVSNPVKLLCAQLTVLQPPSDQPPPPPPPGA